MKIYKWVPISTIEKKKIISKCSNGDNKENATKSGIDSNSNSNFGLATEDSNTCFSIVSDSQGPTEFVPFSEEDSSQGSADGPASKRLKTE